MAVYPSDPKSLVVIDRIVEVLAAIRAGADFFYTPQEVTKRFIHWRDAKGYPTYMVHIASGGVVTNIGTDLYRYQFWLSVKGIVRELGDTVSPLVKSIRDIQKAINDDTKDRSSTGALGTMPCITEIRIDDPPETDNGYLAVEGFGFFDQRIRVSIDGDFGEI